MDFFFQNRGLKKNLYPRRVHKLENLERETQQKQQQLENQLKKKTVISSSLVRANQASKAKHTAPKKLLRIASANRYAQFSCILVETMVIKYFV